VKIAQGYYYDGKNSRRITAELHEELGMLSVQTEKTTLQGACALEDVQISSRIGNTPRHLTFPLNTTFECSDNDAIDQLLKQSNTSIHTGLAHRLESGKRYILIAIIVVITAVWGGIIWGIPTLAYKIAFTLPDSASQHIDQGVLELLDEQLFTPTELPVTTQQRVLNAFIPVSQKYANKLDIEILFRKGGELGPNAMALPSGTIIFTDELIELAKQDEELVAILAHEIGHVIRKHSLRQGIQSSALTLLIVTITGDISSISSIVTAIPLILTELGYSREFEREADRFAMQVMQDQGIPLHKFPDILDRMEKRSRCGDKEKFEALECEQTLNEAGISSYLSTHPPTEERRKQFYITP